MYIPSLLEEPADQPARVIPAPQDASILDWLESTGRLMAGPLVDAQFREDDSELIDELAGEEADYEFEEEEDLVSDDEDDFTL